jgi:hypothetical protein
VVDPTVIAAPTREGEELHAFALLLPAATAYETPSLIELFTALSKALFAPPPKLMLAIAGCPAVWLPVTQSTPAITPELLPEPWQFRTRTATKRTPLATP